MAKAIIQKLRRSTAAKTSDETGRGSGRPRVHGIRSRCTGVCTRYMPKEYTESDSIRRPNGTDFNLMHNSNATMQRPHNNPLSYQRCQGTPC